jgi:glycine/D-amino acid oxidase-like deaminating enzyme
VNLPRFDKLKGEINTEVLIIGGGMCGILCAYYLEQMGVDYILVEGDTIGSGISKNTTAKITSQHGLIYNKMLKSEGLEKAKMYLDANQAAISKFRELSSSIDCDFEVKSAYTYTLEDRKKVEEEIRAVNSLGFKCEFVENMTLPFETKGAIKFEKQAQFNPIKFIAHISKNLKIYENTFVKSISIKENVVLTNDAKITAKNIIVTTHFPFINLHGSYFLKLYQHRSYVIALENAENVKGMYVDEADKGMSFRNYKDLLIIGGGDHRTGKHGGNYTELRRFSQKYYPNAKEKYAWATQDCMSLDRIPYIGHYSKMTQNLFVASGFNKWGMTSSMVSAMILSDMVVGKTNEFEEVFSPHRSMIKPQLFVNGFEAVTNLLTLSTKRCPHMGCTLKWNSTEQTWDCPCHGSRFEKNGDLIDNPATGSITKKIE